MTRSRASGWVFFVRYERQPDATYRTIKSKSNADKRTGRWAYELRTPGGRQRSVSKGGFATRQEAKAALAERMAEIAANPAAAAPASKVTLEQYVDQWFAAVEARGKLRPTTIAGYRDLARAYVLPELGQRRLVDLSAGDLVRLYATLRSTPARSGRPLSETTIHAAHVFIHRLLRHALQQGVVRHNVAASVPDDDRPASPQRDSGKLHHWSPDEARRFLAIVADDRLAAFWTLALHTGMRRGELAGLRWDDVDLDEACTLTVRRTRTIAGGRVVENEPKTDRSRRTLPLASATVAALRAHRRRQLEERLAAGEAWADTGYVFVDELGRPYRPDSLYRRHRRAVERAGVPIIDVHALRHSSATAALAAGESVVVVSARLGHTKTSITHDVYAHALPEHERRAADVIADAFRLSN